MANQSYKVKPAGSGLKLFGDKNDAVIARTLSQRLREEQHPRVRKLGGEFVVHNEVYVEGGYTILHLSKKLPRRIVTKILRSLGVKFKQWRPRSPQIKPPE